MNKTKIDWCDYTWNPVVGCRRGCEYCYARKLHDKRHEAYKKGKKLPHQYAKSFSEMQFFPERLNDQGLKRKKPATIFVGSMTDIFYADNNWLSMINDVTRTYKHHTFMFLSKSHEAYSRCFFPHDNVMRGVTITHVDNSMNKTTVKIVGTIPNSFLSIEPLLGPISIDIPDRIKLVIVGAMTGCGENNVIPKKEWIQSVRDHVSEEKIHWKENIKEYL